MLRDAAVDLLMKRLGNRNDTALKDTIISEMVFVQDFVLEGAFPLPWFLVTKDASLVTVASTETVALPTDYLAAWEDGGLARVDASGDEIRMLREDYDILRKEKTGEGTPDYFDILNETLYLRLVPNSVISLVLWYYAKGVSFSGSYGDANNIENNWLKYAADLVLAETGAIMAANHLQAPKMVVAFEKQAFIARNRLLIRSTAAEESLKQRFMEG